MTLELVATEVPTRREREVIAVLMLHAPHNDELATRLLISPETVKYHLASIMRKLGVNSRAALICYAWQHGVVLEGEWHPFAS